VDGSVARVSVPDRMVRERRRHLRVEPASGRPVELFSHFEGGPTLRLRLTDISRKGVGFIGVHDVNENDEGIFAVLLPGEGNIVISPGTVRFKKSCGDFFRYGVELLVSPRDEQKIERYVLERERETAETAEDE
jgi:c-di-GMP-binding flagellar brake protein YcgR